MPKVRRKLFVSKRFQGFFALYIILTVVVMAFFLGGEFLRSFFAGYGINMEEGGSVSIPFITESSPFAAPLAELNFGFIVKILILLVWGLLMVGIAYVLTANKFSGPLLRINAALRKVSTGDYALRMRFRAHDDAFHEVARNFNLMMDGIHNNVKKDIHLISELESKLSDQGSEEIQSLLAQWKADKKKLIIPDEKLKPKKPAKG